MVLIILLLVKASIIYVFSYTKILIFSLIVFERG